MLVENLLYLATFATTTGLAVIGTLVSYHLLREYSKPFMQILIYQQIFLFGSFIYAIWGTLLLRQVIADVNVPLDLAAKIRFYTPLPAIPFLIVSWFMLLKFGFNLNGYEPGRKWVFIYFGFFFLLLISLMVLFQNSTFSIPPTADQLIIRLFVALNLFFHLIFFYPFFRPKALKILPAGKNEIFRCCLFYLAGVGIYSFFLWYLVFYNYAFTLVSFLLLFTVSAFLPVCLKFGTTLRAMKSQPTGKNFQSFCANYQISKREAEIILEICSGKTNKAIAEKLFITLQTVKDHAHHIYTKTDVKSRVQLANLVREEAGLKNSLDRPR